MLLLMMLCYATANDAMLCYATAKNNNTYSAMLSLLATANINTKNKLSITINSSSKIDEQIIVQDFKILKQQKRSPVLHKELQRTKNDFGNSINDIFIL